MGIVDHKRVEVFLERAATLRSSKAVETIEKTSITVTIANPKAKPVVEIKAPDDEATLAFFARIREFDTPGKSIYVADFFPQLEAGASSKRLEVVDWLRQSHIDLGRESYDRPGQILGPGATPRQVWELWTYAFVLHVDDKKRTVWASLNTWQQGEAQFMAYRYAVDLFHVVTVTEAMLRDRGLDDQGVQMLVSTIHPLGLAAGVPPFQAAKIRLA